MSWKKLKCKIKMMCCCIIDCKRERNNNINNNIYGTSASNYQSTIKAESKTKKEIE